MTIAGLCAIPALLFGLLTGADDRREAPPAERSTGSPLSDRSGASRLDPGPGLFETKATEEPRRGAGPEAPPTPVAEVVAADAGLEQGDPEPPWVVGLHARVATVPGFLLDTVFDDHPSHVDGNTGVFVSIPFTREDRLTIEFDWTGLRFPAGNWRRTNRTPDLAEYVSVDMHMLALDVTYRRSLWFAEDWAIVYGGGLGIAGLAGDARSIAVLPSCQEPVARCAHWRHSTREKVRLPTRVLPVLHLVIGLEWWPGDALAFRLDAGFKNAFYAGLAGGYRF